MTSKEAEALPSPRREETRNVGQSPLTEDILISSPFRSSDATTEGKRKWPSVAFKSGMTMPPVLTRAGHRTWRAEYA
jgi:hypothetical protein